MLKSELGRPPRIRWLAGCLVAAIIGFYFWTITSTQPGPEPLFADHPGGYYDGLMDGFLHGHLYLDLPVDPRLVQAPDPYIPAMRALVPHDLSYYRGHYYIYYGVVPLVTLSLPWRLVTGQHLAQFYAVLIYATGGFLSSAALWLSLRRRYFPGSGAVVLLAGIAVLGLASGTHAVLRRADFWEEPIAAGYCFGMLCLLCLERGLRAPRTALWLGAAGLCLGLAVGSRPTYIAGAAAFLPVLGWLWWRSRTAAGGGPAGSWWRPALALCAGFGAVLAGLAWYNYARFGRPFEFGQTYQGTFAPIARIAGATPRLFDPGFVPFNAFVYYVAPPQWSRYFPFVKMIHVPAGRHNFEFVYGLLTHFPFVWLALLAPLALARRPAAEGGPLTAFLGALALFYAAIGGLLLTFVGAAGRYLVDFTPALMLLAACGLLGAERIAAGRSRRVWRAIGGAAAAFSVFVGVMLSFQLHDLLRTSNSRAYRALAHAFDLPTYAIERLAGTRYGPLELTLRFPRAAAGTLEPLVTTGWEYESDFLFVRYQEGDRLQFGFEHSNQGVLWSPMLEAERGREHHLMVQMGSLFPPPGHPFYDRMSRYAANGFTRWLRVTLDGQTAFDLPQEFYDGSPGSVRLGDNSRSSTDFGVRFTGELLAAQIGPITIPPSDNAGYGPREIDLTLPADTSRPLPLVTAGQTGRGDILRVQQVGPGIVRFGYDHWGVGFWESDPVAMAPGVRHVLKVALPGLLAPGAARADAPNLSLELDGKTVWKRSVPGYAVPPAEFEFGENRIGASTCDAEYTGVILDVKRL